MITYCSNLDINEACNHAYKRLWTAYWVILSYIISISFTILSLYDFSNKYRSYLFLSIIILILLSNLCVIVIIRNRVTNLHNLLFRAAQGAIYTDDDEYWMKGFYKNPNDQNVSIERRIGYGLEFNTATLTGKILTYGILFIVIIILLLVFIYKLRIDFFT